MMVEGPRRGFSLKGWKENLPSWLAKRQTSLSNLEGQSLRYMVYTNIATLVTKMSGTSHGVHSLGGGGRKVGGGGGG